MGQRLRAAKGTHFSGLISEVGPREWRARGWIREPDSTLKQTIGPKTLATVPLARDWLNQAAAKHGFESFDIVVERLGDEGLLVERVRPEEAVEDHMIANDVDAPKDRLSPHPLGATIISAQMSRIKRSPSDGGCQHGASPVPYGGPVMGREKPITLPS